MIYLKRACTIFVGLLTVFIFFQSAALGIEEIKWRIGGFYCNETSWRTHKPNELMEMTNIFQLELNYFLNNKINFYFEGRGFWDGALQMQDKGWTKNDFLKDKLSYPLAHTQMDPVREFWADMKFEKLSLRLGKQQIVWGNTEGVKMLDIICPTDYREFTQDKFEESRISIWAMNLEYLVAPGMTIQFIFNPAPETNFSAPMFSPYEIQIARLSDYSVQSHIVRYRNIKPDRSFDSSNWGFRWKHVLGGFEYTLNYWNAWTPYPGVWFAGTEPNPKSPLGYTILLNKEYRRRQSIGGSFSKTVTKWGPFTNFVLRGEGVVNLKDIATIYDSKAGLGQVRSDNYNYALCLDRSWYPWWAQSGFNLEFQFFQTCTLDFKKNFVNSLTAGPWDKYENSWSVYAYTDYLNQTIKPEVIVVYGTNHKECWVRPRISYDISDHWQATLGGNIYWGDRNTIWGQFRDNDQIGLELKYGF